MASKNNAEVIINGKIYTLSGYESEEYLQKVASYINKKMDEFKDDDGFKRQSMDVQRTLIELNIADDYFKAKKQADMLEAELEGKEKQMNDLKHSLIAAQIKLETSEKEIVDLEKEINECQKEIVRLETELKDAFK